MFRAKCVRPGTQAFLLVRQAELHSAVLGQRGASSRWCSGLETRWAHRPQARVPVLLEMSRLRSTDKTAPGNSEAANHRWPKSKSTIGKAL
jgi:hypothetical protein